MKFKQYQRIVTIGIACLAMMVSVACQIDETLPSENLTSDLEKISFNLIDLSEQIEAAQLINSVSLTANGPLADANIIIANASGLSVLNKSGKTLRQFKGYFKTIDHRITPKALFIASVSGDLQQTVVTTIGLNTGDWSAPLMIPKSNFKTEDACLYQDDANNTFVFLVGEEGLGEQWLVAGENTLLEKALLVRSLSLPPESKYCQVDDDTNTLYVNEENVGVWAYAAEDEAALLREPVAMLAPFGDIKNNASGMAISNHQILVLDADSQQLHRYNLNLDGDQTVGITPPLGLDTLNSPENLSVRPTKKGLEVMVHDKSGLHMGLIPLSDIAYTGPQHHTDRITALVKPLFETDLIPSLGDAADDPAIWIHPTQATKSLVIATDKQSGLAVYDLQGKEKQYLAVGRLNNVDIRTGFNLNGTLIDLAVASNRDHNSLHLFSIDRNTGVVAELGQQATSTNEIYGACMFKDKQNNFYAIVNDKDGRFEQYQLTTIDKQITAKKVREFKVATQPEGCVAIDQIEQLFVGEENTALWTLNARGDAAITMTKVIEIGEVVHADIEGVAYYKGPKNAYLVISSQGNDSYVVVESSSPYKHRGTFKIAMNAPLGIDGASETDGLEVTSADLSGNNSGPWRLGMLVVQDGRKRMPEGKQNYKYVPWLAIAEALNLE